MHRDASSASGFGNWVCKDLKGTLRHWLRLCLRMSRKPLLQVTKFLSLWHPKRFFAKVLRITYEPTYLARGQCPVNAIPSDFSQQCNFHRLGLMPCEVGGGSPNGTTGLCPYRTTGLRFHSFPVALDFPAQGQSCHPGHCHSLTNDMPCSLRTWLHETIF